MSAEHEGGNDTNAEDAEGTSGATDSNLDTLGTSWNSTHHLIFVDDDDDADLLNCWTPSTASEGQDSDENKDSSGSSVSFHDPEDNEIVCPFFPTSLPYAQLVYDPNLRTLITLLEVSLAIHSENALQDGTTSAPKRLRMIDRRPRGYVDDACDAPMVSATRSTESTGSESDYSIARFGAFEDLPVKVITPDATSTSYPREPIIFATETHPDAWLEDALELYLLHESQDYLEETGKSSSSCAEALRKLLLASKSLVVFRSRNGESAGDWHKVSRDPFPGVGYSYLLEI
jgi:hypothetical protein